MSIETNCPSCNSVLRVADQHAGRQARCPVCGTIYIVPDESVASARKPAGERFGGVPETTPGPSSHSYQTPHRGAVILVLGILGWAFWCVPLGVIAWVIGNSDLWEMECGRMDQTGRGLTQAGRILGMIQTLLCLLVFLGGIVVLVFIGLLSA